MFGPVKQSDIAELWAIRLKKDKEFCKKIVAIKIVVTKKDIWNIHSSQQAINKIIESGYKVFYDTIVDICHEYKIMEYNNFMLEVIPFSIGKFMPGNLYNFDDSDAKILLDSIRRDLDNNHKKKGFVNKIRKILNMIFPFKKTYSDAEYVYGVKNGNSKIQNSFYEHCKDYFNQKYKKLFFTDDDKKNDIFEDAFIIVWQKIERGEIYVQHGHLVTHGGKKMTCSLNTFMMSVAWNKFREYARKHRETLFEDMFENAGNVLGVSSPWGDSGDEIEGMKLDIITTCIAKMPQRCCQILTMFYYEGKKLDNIMMELQSFTSKDALKTAKNKCYTTLKNNVLQQYKVAMINY